MERCDYNGYKFGCKKESTRRNEYENSYPDLNFESEFVRHQSVSKSARNHLETEVLYKEEKVCDWARVNKNKKLVELQNLYFKNDNSKKMNKQKYLYRWGWDESETKGPR
ncbi:unnamed protein product, partial [Brachionus calyciflorus]